MKNDNIIVIIGAGPYGLSIAAYLKAYGVPTLIFGKRMELWQKMPRGMYLKSIWSASSLPDPIGKLTLDHYAEEKNITRKEPIPLPLFLNYVCWYQQCTGVVVDPTFVQLLTTDGKGFHLELTDGRIVKASHVIVAVGISSFTYVPDYARNLPDTVASHTSAHSDLTPFSTQNVAVVGRGQSALEYAGLLHEAGATVEVIARGSVRWHSKILYDHTGPARHIFYPPGDVGPPGINWLVAFPGLYRHLPEKIKYLVHRRAVLPGGAKWLRPRVEGKVQLTENTQVVKAYAKKGKVYLDLNDGTRRELDYLFLGTGYQPSIHKLAFIDIALRRQLQEKDGYPLLNGRFESSIPRLFFAGALAGGTFGPTCRFITGANAVVRQIAHLVLQTI